MASSDRNRKTLIACVVVVAGMTGLSFASVPLYDLFCRVTGYGGTTQVAATDYYRATNLESTANTGTATFNVTPQKAGLYFAKIDCFCFTEQQLDPGQTVEMPVTFYVDPELDTEPNLDEVKIITLSYTFFRAETDNKAAVDKTAFVKPITKKPAEIN